MTSMRVMLFVVISLFCTLPQAHSASAEEKGYDAAMRAFQDQMWQRAEQELKDFTIRFPKSPDVPAATLYQARALVMLGKYNEAITLLQKSLGQAGNLTDEYRFWISESYYQAGNYHESARLFQQVIIEHPTSVRALESVLGLTSSQVQLKQWRGVIETLSVSDGIYQRAVAAPEVSPFVARGQLQLAEALLELNDYDGAEKALASPLLSALEPAMAWEWQKQYARLWLARGRYAEALSSITNMVDLAIMAGQPGLQAEAVFLQGRVFEDMGNVDKAVASYRQNLATNSPPVTQRQALIRLSSLFIRQDRLTEARTTLDQFLTQSPEEYNAALARLTVGELKLRQHLQGFQSGVATNNQPAVTQTNLLSEVIADSDQVIASTSDEFLRGRAQLNKGWSLWLGGDFASSASAFEQAALLLQGTDDQAVARFKWADAQFRLQDFDGARTNYDAVVELTQVAGTEAANRVESALYQTLRSALAMEQPDLAITSMERLLADYPDGFLAGPAVLLMGQEWSALGSPETARSLFYEFLEQSPESALAPEIRLAIARTFEAEADWARAIEQYEAMLAGTNHASIRARTEFFLAMDTALSGSESNAVASLTNFVVVYATNELAPRAQWWVGDYHWRQEDYINAELNYQYVFRNWPESSLAYEARMMAGRAAMARLSVRDAISYFTNLTSDLTCPADVKVKAMFAYGDALMRLKSTDTNNPYANYEEAIRVFSAVDRLYPSNHLGIHALGQAGNCYLQLAVADPRGYQAASNAYQRVVESPYGSLAARSEAELGQAVVLEKLALAQSGESRTNLLQQALDRYLNVLYEKNIREGEQADPFWVRKAGLEAGRIAEFLQSWSQALRIYERLEGMIPALQPMLENKILKAQEQVTRAQT